MLSPLSESRREYYASEKRGNWVAQQPACGDSRMPAGILARDQDRRFERLVEPDPSSFFERTADDPKSRWGFPRMAERTSSVMLFTYPYPPVGW
jgi:hypothetical protein